MPVTVRIPTALRTYTSDQSKIALDAASVEDAVRELVDRHDGLRRHLYTDEGDLRAHVNYYVNNEDVREMDGAGTALQDGDTLVIVPAVAGGGP